MTRSKPLVIGVTGLTGSGKSLVAETLRKRGAYIIDADKIAHAILLPGGGAYDEVVANLGESILDDGFINRKKVAAIVFSDAEKLRQHTATTHKHILLKIYDEIDDAKRNNSDIICIDAPLLIESGLHKSCDVTWVVHAEEDIRMERIMRRDGITRGEAARRMAVRAPFAETARHADAVFINDSDPEALAQAVTDKLNELHD